MSDTLCRRFRLIHVCGDVLYPARIKDRESDEVAFRLAKGGNTKDDSISVQSEEEMIAKVLRQGFRVRARTEKPVSRGGRAGLYAIDEQAIRSYELIETGEVHA
ncbi:hypothetical protein [Marinobacter apostichopi]|uniref:hypothetical protein n=1 Tax=Marinobacter apostichopi TaxID=3035454 RepID=UPI0025736DBA|nr:hypothetical protein [Marinobacter sp. LA51]